jgi:hypothetical protein
VANAQLTADQVNWLAECLRVSNIDPDARSQLMRIIYNWEQIEMAAVPQKKGRKPSHSAMLAHMVRDVCAKYEASPEEAEALVREVAGGFARAVSAPALAKAITRQRAAGFAVAGLSPEDEALLYLMMENADKLARKLKLPPKK